MRNRTRNTWHGLSRRRHMKKRLMYEGCFLEWTNYEWVDNEPRPTSLTGRFVLESNQSISVGQCTHKSH